ncbi:MAG TPA: potassium channel family protein [Actinomycetota bacterium]
MSVGTFVADRRYGILFGTLLLAILGAPFVAMLPVGQGFVVWAILLVLMLAAANALRESPPGRLALVLGLVLAYAGLLLWDVVAPDRAARVAAQVAGIVFLAMVAIDIARSVLSAEEVTADLLLAAASLYLLLGFAWSRVYMLMEVSWPGSFEFPARLGYVADSPLAEVSALVYFSFVTLTTLGYGDVTPVSEAARRVAIAEAIVGQLFIAITVARLVGTYAATRRSPPPDDRTRRE